MRRQFTTGNLPVVQHHRSEGALRGTEVRLGRGPRRRRAQWPLYRPHPPGLSTMFFQKNVTERKLVRVRAGKRCGTGLFAIEKLLQCGMDREKCAKRHAALEPQSYDDLASDRFWPVTTRYRRG